MRYGRTCQLARLDAPGVMHHVIGRGIERRKIFLNDGDRVDFISRLSTLVQEGAMEIYAWALIPNHFHLLCRTRDLPLATSMRKLLTGYVVNFNKRHQRHGDLFQNRYKSIVCQEDPYLVLIWKLPFPDSSFQRSAFSRQLKNNTNNILS